MYRETMLLPEPLDWTSNVSRPPRRWKKRALLSQSSYSVSVIIEAMGLLQKCWMSPLAAESADWQAAQSISHMVS